MKSWLINSNSNEDNGNENGFLYMLRQNKVSTFYDKKEKINTVSPGDLILLYHNDNRVIAFGFALNMQKHDFEPIREIEHWVDVNWIWKASFDTNHNPTNPINRKDIGITMVNGSVINITDQVDLKLLLEKIGERQLFI